MGEVLNKTLEQTRTCNDPVGLFLRLHQATESVGSGWEGCHLRYVGILMSIGQGGAQGHTGSQIDTNRTLQG